MWSPSFLAQLGGWKAGRTHEGRPKDCFFINNKKKKMKKKRVID